MSKFTVLHAPGLEEQARDIASKLDMDEIARMIVEKYREEKAPGERPPSGHKDEGLDPSEEKDERQEPHKA